MFPLQAAVGATAAFNNAKQTRAAVGKTLRDINSLLANMSECKVFIHSFICGFFHFNIPPRLIPAGLSRISLWQLFSRWLCHANNVWSELWKWSNVSWTQRKNQIRPHALTNTKDVRVRVLFRFPYPMCSSSPQTSLVQWMRSIWSSWRILWLVLREKWITIWSLGTGTWRSRRLPWDVNLSTSTRTSTPSWEISLTWRTSWKPSLKAASTTRP